MQKGYSRKSAKEAWEQTMGQGSEGGRHTGGFETSRQGMGDS